MAKKKTKTSWLKWSIGSWIGWKSLNYIVNHPHFIRDLKLSFNSYLTALSDLIDALQSLKANSAQLQVELKKTERTVNQIDRSVDRFQYKLQPRLDTISELQKHITNELNQVQKQTLDKKRK